MCGHEDRSHELYNRKLHAFLSGPGLQKVGHGNGGGEATGRQDRCQGQSNRAGRRPVDRPVQRPLHGQPLLIPEAGVCADGHADQQADGTQDDDELNQRDDPANQNSRRQCNDFGSGKQAAIRRSDPPGDAPAGLSRIDEYTSQFISNLI